MASGRDDLLRRLSLALAEEMRARARERCPSKTLQRAMVAEDPRLDGDGVEGGVFLPHYWAPMYHDGRGPSPKNPQPRLQVIYFRNKSDDPRTDGGTNYPVRLSDVRHLSKKQFKEARARGQIVVRLQVGPAQGHPFFDQAEPGFFAETDGIVAPEFDSYVRGLLPSETREIRVRAG